MLTDRQLISYDIFDTTVVRGNVRGHVKGDAYENENKDRVYAVCLPSLPTSDAPAVTLSPQHSPPVRT
jgi:hypothetical protein